MTEQANEPIHLNRELISRLMLATGLGPQTIAGHLKMGTKPRNHVIRDRWEKACLGQVENLMAPELPAGR